MVPAQKSPISPITTIDAACLRRNLTGSRQREVTTSSAVAFLMSAWSSLSRSVRPFPPLPLLGTTSGSSDTQSPSLV